MATHIAGIAIERKRAEDRIYFMAHHDDLTGLAGTAPFSRRTWRRSCSRLGVTAAR